MSNSASTSIISSAIPRCCSVRADRFTGEVQLRDAVAAHATRRAVQQRRGTSRRSTETMSPVSSARGNQASGARDAARSGGHQRASASKPSSRPVTRSTTGWNHGTISPSRSASTIWPRRSIRSSSSADIPVWYRAQPPPARFAVYIATSASRSRSPATLSPALAVVTPMLTDSRSSRPWSDDRLLEAAWSTRSTQASTSPANSTANSSPPNRAIRSVRSRSGAQPDRDVPEQQVAGVVAERVVDRLEVVEVEERDRRAFAPSASAASSASTNRSRLASPVNVSWLTLRLSFVDDALPVVHDLLELVLAGRQLAQRGRSASATSPLPRATPSRISTVAATAMNTTSQRSRP